MPPKKKKTQLKPVVRGFATVSVPKKVTQESKLEPESAEPAKNALEPQQETPTDDLKPQEESSAQNAPPLTAEELLAVGIVDRLQEKTEREIIRTLKSIEVDRRFSKTLPRFELDPQIRKKILDLIADDDPPTFDYVDESDDRCLLRLATTYGVLRRLGFAEESVQECLQKSPGTDLDQALDWLYFTLPEENLNPVVRRINRKPKTLEPGPAPKQNQNAQRDTEPDGSQGSSQILSPSDHLADQLDDSDDDSDPTMAYVSLRLKQEELAPSANNSGVIRGLQQRLQVLENDPIFDKQSAMKAYRNLKVVQERRLHHERLSRPINVDSTSSEPNVHPQSTSPVPPPVSQIPAISASSTVLDARPQSPSRDSDSDTSSAGGIFGGLEDAMATELTVKGITYQMKDMSLPKNWSGQTPKKLLSDLVLKTDRYATITYRILSGHSRAVRAAVTVSWRDESRPIDEWTMDDFACPQVAQAEQYIALVAFHDLTYPIMDGFALISQPGSTSFRLLPPVYRELWDQLESRRSEHNLRLNLGVWTQLISIAKHRESCALRKPPTKETKLAQVLPEQQTHKSTSIEDWNVASSLLLARQTTFEYQNKLSQRDTLPISQYREEIVKALSESQVLVLSGETGCGKSTQVPSFILEHSASVGTPCKIICTEPRRISAISLAKRVSYELCDPPNSVGTSSSLVGYSIRLENNMSRNTRLGFVTNGIALRMFEGGSSLDEITHIVVDEVHERGVDSDFLLIVLKSLLKANRTIKIILMSATVDADKISAYFDNCPTLFVPGRTYPVETFFLEDAIECTKWIVPDNSPYLRKKFDKYAQNKPRQDWSEDATIVDDDEEEDDDPVALSVKSLEKKYSAETISTMDNLDDRLMPYELIVKLLETIHFERSKFAEFSQAVLVFLPGLEEIRTLNELLAKHPSFGSDLFRIYPLHSTLTSESQGAVFDIPPPGIFKIVIATNIAETGITIPDITCVIDSGKHREMRYDERRQISRLAQTFIARSNAIQRRGRAGRVQPGLCFHLFSKFRYETKMAQNPLPEMLRLSLATLGLRIKIMKLKLGISIEDVLSKALDPPSSVNIQRAVSALVEVKALTQSEDLTPMGRLLSKLPTDVHLGKFLLVATFMGCLDPALTIAATLNSKSPFVHPLGLEQEANRAKASFRVENSDFLTIHNAFSSWRRACSNVGMARKFCRINFLSYQNLQQIEDLRQQFLGYLIDSSFINADASIVKELNRARYSRNQVRFVDVPFETNINSTNVHIINAALAAGLYPKVLYVEPKAGTLKTITNNQQSFFHPSSVNFGRNATDFGTRYLVYFTLMHSKKLYAWETGPIEELCLILLCGDADTKLVSNILFLDKRIQFQVEPKTHIALRRLRSRLLQAFNARCGLKPPSGHLQMWRDLGLLALSKVKLADGELLLPSHS